MNNASQLPWDASFYTHSELFHPIRYWAEKFSEFENWPTLEVYQHYLDSLPGPICTLAGQPLKIVEQDTTPTCFEEHYAPRIYYTGEIQTRRENWHDFFQYLTWFIFPKSKSIINSLHIPRAKKRIEQGEALGRRSPLENMLSLFDEGGVVLVSSNEKLLQLVKSFQWKALFWSHRAVLENQFHCVPFGHAIYEKALLPYIGMTANGILLLADESYFHWPLSKQLAWIDERLEAILQNGGLSKPKDLSPFPILGMPGWDKRNSDESYYENSDYFRPGRTRGAQQVTEVA